MPNRRHAPNGPPASGQTDALSHLFTWIGLADLQAAENESVIGLGPIGQAVTALRFDEIHLLNNLEPNRVERFLGWLRTKTTATLRSHQAVLAQPMHFGDIFRACRTVLLEIEQDAGDRVRRTFHLSPGTPAMAAVWILLAKTRFPSELINSSRDHGVQRAEVPFDIAAEFLPDLLRGPDEHLAHLSAGLPPEAPAFESIVHRSAGMRRVITQARQVALRRISVLIEGESGTGKELLARAIHNAGPRSGRRFVAVNCGALPESLVESLLFGHERGAFTGAQRAQAGYFEQADGGTLFLDEIAELPLPAQVKLLRALQEGEILPLGASDPRKVNVRIIAATNRSLIEEMAAGRFREDLYYRVGVAVLRLPPLRDREGDMKPLIHHLMDQINAETETEPGYTPRKLSPGAQQAILAHSWPGNVRELLNTLLRAAVWSAGTAITESEMRSAIQPRSTVAVNAVLDRPLGDGLSLPDLHAEVARHYLMRAVREAHGNKSRAAELVGLSSYQTLTNWMMKYGVRIEQD